TRPTFPGWPRFGTLQSRRSFPDAIVSVATTKTDIQRMRLPLPSASAPATEVNGPGPRPWGLIGAAAVVAAIGATVLALNKLAMKDSGAQTTSAHARTRLVVTEKAPPPSSNLEASAAYRAAMQAFRDGTFEAVRDGLQRAASLDPGMAA